MVWIPEEERYRDSRRGEGCRRWRCLGEEAREMDEELDGLSERYVGCWSR